MAYFYDGWMHFFWASKSQVPFTPIIKLGASIWKSQHSFYITQNCVWLKEESHIHLEWLEGEFMG